MAEGTTHRRRRRARHERGRALGRPLRLAARRPSSRGSRSRRTSTGSSPPYDLAGSRAHARALAAAGYLERRRARRRCSPASTRSRPSVSSGEVVAGDADEDVHGALEAALIGIVGPELGGKLRAGRSRNDQIATLVRLYLKDHAATIGQQLVHLIDALAAQADAHRTAVMPGRTHLQHAQPVLLAHHLLAHGWALSRDLERLVDWTKRADVSPYGGGALAGSHARPRRGIRRPRPRPRGAGRELDRRHREPRRRRRVRLRRRDDRHRPLAHRRGDHPLEHARVRLRHARRRLLDRVVDHAAEEEPRHRRARARQVGPAHRQPHGPARDAQGAAARVQPRPAGGQGAGLRLGRDARGAAAGVHRHDRHAHLPHRAHGRARARRDSRWRRMSRSGS